MTRFATRVLDRFFTPRMPEPYAGPTRRWILLLVFCSVLLVFPGVAVLSALIGLGDVVAGRSVDPLGDYSLASSVVEVVFTALPIAMVWGGLRLTGDRFRRLGLLSRPRREIWSSVGWTFVWIFALGGLVEYAAGLLLRAVPQADRYSAQIAPAADVSFGRLALVGIPAAIGAGLAEEIVVLGFSYRVLERLGVGDRTILVLLVLLRLSYHVYYGVATVVLLPWAFLSVVYYRRYRLLWPLIIGHAVWDTFAILSSVSVAVQVSGLVLLALIVIAATVVAGRRWRAIRHGPLLTLAIPRPRPQWARPGRAPAPASLR